MAGKRAAGGVLPCGRGGRSIESEQMKGEAIGRMEQRRAT